MSGDKVTIDPELAPSNGGGDRDDDGRKPGWLVGVVIAGAALLVFWLFRVSAPDPPEPTPLATVAAPTLADTPASPNTTTGPVAIERPVDGVSLARAVPSFAGVVTALAWNNEGVDIMRWRGEQAAPETLMSFDHSDGSSNRSLDASGEWFSEIQGDSALVVRAVSGRDSQPGSGRLFEQVGVQLRSAVWHDMRPGRLAWLACDVEASGNSTTVYTRDLTAQAVSQTVLRLDVPCEDRDVWLAGWGDWGMLLHRTGASGTIQTLLDVDGTQVAEGRLDPEGEWFVGTGPGSTTVWTEGLGDRPSESFALSPDGLDRSPVPGLLPGERLESALVSPDGSQLALVLDLEANFGSGVRIADADGSVVAEITQPSFWVNGMVWSTDNRYLIYQRWPDITANRAGIPHGVELVFYDTNAADGVALPLSGYASLLRSAR